MHRALCCRVLRHTVGPRTLSTVGSRTFASKSSSWTENMPKWGVPVADGAVGEIAELLCGVGALVRTDEAIAVIETDKVTVDIRATRDGVVAEVLASVGETVMEGQPLYRFEPVKVGATLDDFDVQRRWAAEHQRRRERQAKDDRLHWV